jgi:RNA polymerase sigma-70 factor (ECF subfamily)
MVHNDEDAEDLLLETFAKAFKHLPRFKPVYAFGTWLCRIAINHALDFVRRRKGQAFSLDAYPEEQAFDLISEYPGPEESLFRRERLGQLLDSIDRLPPDYQAIARLRYLGEFSYREIAEQLTTPMGTVKARLNRSRKLLTKQLGYRE